MKELRIECRVQYLRKGEWVTIGEPGDASLVVEGDLADENERLGAEVERLRTALSQYATVANWGSLPAIGYRSCWQLEEPGYQVAVTALEKKL